MISFVTQPELPHCLLCVFFPVPGSQGRAGRNLWKMSYQNEVQLVHSGPSLSTSVSIMRE